MSEAFLRLGEVMRRTGLGKTAIYDAIAASEFPKQIKLGRRLSVWIEGEIDAWVQAKIEAHRAKLAAPAQEKRKRGRPRKSPRPEAAPVE